MKTSLSNAPVDSLLGKVMNFDHPAVVSRIARKNGLTLERAAEVFYATKQFLYICGTRHGKWGPSSDIDMGWHEFLMFTKDYQGFCEQFFGRFIHHFPRVEGEAADRFRPKRTLLAAIELLGCENLSGCWEYRSPDGSISIGPKTPGIDEWYPHQGAELLSGGPCDSCGCSPND